MLELKNISFFQDNKEILKDINLKIEASKFIAITGPNGSRQVYSSKNHHGYLYSKHTDRLFLMDKI